MPKKKDDPAEMDRMRDWLSEVTDDLGIERELINHLEVPLLDVVGTIAHGPSRPGAPLTAFLIGVAVGRGGDGVDLTSRVESLAQGYGPA